MYASLRQLMPQYTTDFVDGEALLALIPKLRPLAKTPQDSVYHAEGDVWTHTLMVLDAIKELPAYAHANEDDRFVLFASALFHDIAKPSCTREENGRITSAGHSRRGAVDTRVLLWRAGVPFTLRERVCRIVASHQAPFFILGSDRRGRRPEFILHQLSEEGRFCDLHTVAEADMRGRDYHGKDHILGDLELAKIFAKEEGCWTGAKRFPDAHTRLAYFRSNGGTYADHAFHQEKGSRVIVLSGLPASGKNTWVAHHHPDLPVISFDDAKAELGIKHGDNVGAAVHLANDKARTLLRQKAPFVWNATHLSPLMRNKTLDLLYAYHAEVELVYLETDEQTIKERNQSRNSTLTNAGIDAMLCRWEVPLPWEAHHVRYEAT